MPLLRAFSLLIFAFVFPTTGLTEDRKLDIPVPLNEDVLGIRIPYYNEEGFLEMRLDARVARKIDANHVTFKDIKIKFFEKNSDSLSLKMPTAVFDLQTNILYGNHGVTIKRQDLDISGHSIILHTRERFARFQGKVKMTILNFDLSSHPNSANTPK